MRQAIWSSAKRPATSIHLLRCAVRYVLWKSKKLFQQDHWTLIIFTYPGFMCIALSKVNMKNASNSAQRAHGRRLDQWHGIAIKWPHARHKSFKMACT